MKHAVLAVCLGVLAAGGFAPRTVRLCEGFAPPNNMKIPVGDMNALGIDEAAFNQVLDRVEKVYAPILAAKGKTLVVERRWADPTVNAYANQTGDTWYIHMYGGLARHKAVTSDGFALVACHELGHHLGGYPRYDGDGWASNEGQSDYYGTLKCLRQILPAKSAADVDAIAKEACKAIWSGSDERAHCETGTMAGLSAASLLAELGGEPAVSLAVTDPAVVDATSDYHPAAQCRLDTYAAGARCTKPVSEALSATEPGPGACTKSQGFATGLRARCWYAPPSAEAESVAAKPLGLMPQKSLEDRLESMRSALEGGSGR